MVFSVPWSKDPLKEIRCPARPRIPEPAVAMPCTEHVVVLTMPWSLVRRGQQILSVRSGALPARGTNSERIRRPPAARAHLRAIARRALRCAIRGPGGPFRARIGASPGHPSAGCAEGAGHGIASSQQPAPGHAMAGLWPASAHRLVQNWSRRFPASDGLGPQRARQGGEAGQVVDPVPVHAAAHRRAGARPPACLFDDPPECINTRILYMFVPPPSSPTTQSPRPLGSGPMYQILLHVFALCASQKTHGHARIARATCKKV